MGELFGIGQQSQANEWIHGYDLIHNVRELYDKKYFFGNSTTTRKILLCRHAFVYRETMGDSATSPIMKREKYNKQEASRKMSWMSFLDSK
jgi:hypothetical protein